MRTRDPRQPGHDEFFSSGVSLDRLHREVFFLAYHLHWSYADLMDMAVGERHHYVRLLAEQIEQENARIEAAHAR
ncbi:MAG: hypothetical protein JST91_05495 [Actinobacteria bacterium]|nr:hypothetical protein [Actinomycetota bacterium]